ncbi:MAG: hypothetical protein LiPW30_744 [Parcubacteria group bacterium LiPW_30]|nr:MAG: hypothetical protein LiPW30_744 [Parcubacteria group bacterium LiPW_30]
MNNKGFTLIELVIAIFILTVAIIGVYSAFSTVVVLTAGASSRLTAAYLAQEGVEIVRNMRDNNWLNSRDWKTGLLGCGGGCEADYKTGTSPTLTLTPYPSGGNWLRIDADNFYSYDPADNQTKFKRKITITPQGADVLKVFVSVTWKEKDEEGCVPAGYCVEVEEYLYNWY